MVPTISALPTTTFTTASIPQGVHYGMFPGEGKHPTTVWTAIRPHNWRPTTTKEHLVEFDMRTGAAARQSLNM